MKKILFLTPYPFGMAASQRFRFEQYFGELNKAGFNYFISSFMTSGAFRTWYGKGNLYKKAFYVLVGFYRRLRILFQLHQFDYVFIHREVVPVGPPIFEFLIAKVFRKKIIYDFDDAIWIPNASDSNRFFKFLKFYSSVKLLTKWAHKVSCGNAFLCSFAKLLNPNSFYNPTTIDTEKHHNRFKVAGGSKRIVIGWTGSHSTLRYIEDLFPVLRQLKQKHDFDFHLISDLPPSEIPSFVSFVKWSKQSEIDDLLQLDIGLMPLADDRWAKGKCGFKALQYMALGIPALVSPVGVNPKIVDHNVNGFICRDNEEWFRYLDLLLSSPHRIAELSKATRKKVEDHYSVKSNAHNFVNLFRNNHEEYSPD